MKLSLAEAMQAVDELVRRAPAFTAPATDETPVRRVEAAYRAGLVEAWYAAAVLGALGHEAAVPLLEEILQMRPRDLATACKVTEALARIEGDAAVPRLEAMLFSGATRVQREAAAHALSTESKPTNLVTTILRAAHERKLLPPSAAQSLRNANVSAATLLALLTASEEHSKRLGMHLVYLGGRAHVASSDVPAAVRALLADPELRVSPSHREGLTVLSR